MAETEDAEDRIPGACGNCTSSNVHPHCPSPTCTWAKCDVCRAVSGVVDGELRVVGGIGGLP